MPSRITHTVFPAICGSSTTTLNCCAERRRKGGHYVIYCPGSRLGRCRPGHQSPGKWDSFFPAADIPPFSASLPTATIIFAFPLQNERLTAEADGGRGHVCRGRGRGRGGPQRGRDREAVTVVNAFGPPRPRPYRLFEGESRGAQTAASLPSSPVKCVAEVGLPQSAIEYKCLLLLGEPPSCRPAGTEDKQGSAVLPPLSSLSTADLPLGRDLGVSQKTGQLLNDFVSGVQASDELLLTRT